MNIMPYGFKDIAGGVWSNEQVDTYNRLRRDGKTGQASRFFMDMLELSKPGSVIKFYG